MKHYHNPTIKGTVRKCSMCSEHTYKPATHYHLLTNNATVTAHACFDRCHYPEIPKIDLTE